MTAKLENEIERLRSEPKILCEANLEPVQGQRFQPTGFPDLGAAEYTAPDGTQMLLVESPQSMANRMEEVCWDPEEGDLIGPLRGLPYVKVELDDEGNFTNSILEAHRLNSEYITGSMNKKFNEILSKEIGYDPKKPVQFVRLHRVLFKYDPNSLVHGIFLEEIGGRLRVPRMLSAFIEALGVKPVQSGGVKFSRVEPTRKRGEGSEGKKGEGNVPFTRTEFVAEKMTAYFNIDLAGIRGLGLGELSEKLLITLSMYKIQRFLNQGLRLRTACDLTCKEGAVVVEPRYFTIPSEQELEESVIRYIGECRNEGLFADSPTVLKLKE